jgi:hypothetical protein
MKSASYKMNPSTFSFVCRERYIKNILSIKVTTLCSWKTRNLVILTSVLVLQELYYYRNYVVLSTSAALNNSNYILLFPKYIKLYEEFCCVVSKSSL